MRPRLIAPGSGWFPAALIAGLLIMAAVGLAWSQPSGSGAVATTSTAEVCARDGAGHFTYSRSHRVVMRRGRAGYEHDHVVPICLGGADTEANLQWQALDEAREKDRAEWAACRAVCNGQLGLTEAQGRFLRGEWRTMLR